MFRALAYSFAVHLAAALLALFLIPPQTPEEPTIIRMQLSHHVEAVTRDEQRVSGPAKIARSKYNLPAKQAVPTPKSRNGLFRRETEPQLAVADLTHLSGFNEQRDWVRSKAMKPVETPKELRLRDKGGWKGSIKHNGRVAFQDKPLYDITNPLRAPDLTEVVMRIRGDPLYDPEKRKFLAETREMREQMARDAKQENLGQALREIRSELLAIWDNKTLSLDYKKQRFFELWDECTESGSEEAISSAKMIRVTIMTFVNRHLGKESEATYTEVELEKLNASRTSSLVFAPYES